jgi:DNA-binding transcriptional ArsR family regulator
MDADNRPSRGPLPGDQVNLAVEVFRMLADNTRIQLLWALTDRELSVNELAAEIGKLPASVSQHLAKLRISRLVRTRREGTQIYYRLENEHIARLVTDALYNADHASAEVPEHHRADAGVTALPQPSSAAGVDTP